MANVRARCCKLFRQPCLELCLKSAFEGAPLLCMKFWQEVVVRLLLCSRTADVSLLCAWVRLCPTDLKCIRANEDFCFLLS